MARTARPVTGITDFVYDGNALIAEYTNAGALLRRAVCPERSRYVHGSNVEADDPLIVYEGATVSNATRRYLHADPRGSIVAVSDYQGNTLSTNAYDEYGIPDAATQAAGSTGDIATKGRFRYTGQAYIPELGMYYYKARIYSPTLGRFLQTDPIGYEDQFNRYAYVANDPVNGIDFDGKQHAFMFSLGEQSRIAEYDKDPNTNGPAAAANFADTVSTASPISAGEMIVVRASRAAVEAAKRPGLLTRVLRGIKGFFGGKKATCCFVAGTLVDTEEGLRPIEEIAVGDKVWARDEETGETALKPVTDLIQRHERVIWEVSLTGANGEAETFETTDDHPWWIAGQGWKRTEELVAGMAVVTKDGRGMVLASVIETGRTDVTYNLTVADFETYFVGEQRVLVHNCPGTYEVPGDRTPSGKRYIGQDGKDTPAQRAGNGRDGRVRQAGDRVTEMPGSARREREIQEQREMNAAGGVENLDNQRNSVSPKKWEELGIDPPK